MVAGATEQSSSSRSRKNKTSPKSTASGSRNIQRDAGELPELPESCKPSNGLSSTMKIEDECVITIDGRTYDLTKWADHHPGGPLIRQYNGLDATYVFNALHSDEARKKLLQFTPMTSPAPRHVPPPPDLRSQKILEDFDALKKEIAKEGFFDASMGWYVYKIATTLLLCPLGLVFHAYQWYLTSAILIGLFWQQLGWLGHEASHHQLFKSRLANDYMSWFLGNVCQGFSGHWWKDRHNSHHATTNILDADPDIDNIPMLAWSQSDLRKAPKWCLRTIPYQAYYFLGLLPLLRLAWCQGSITFVQAMKNSRYKRYEDEYRWEALGLTIHWICVVFLLASLPTWSWVVVYFLVSELLAGFGIAIVVFFNHYSCEKYPANLAGNFVCLQLWTTRNMTPGVITDWICGGLNYQIEHHLFPTVPRHKLYKLSFKVKAFCKSHSLPYLCSDFYPGLLKVLDFLNQIGELAKQEQASQH